MCTVPPLRWCGAGVGTLHAPQAPQACQLRNPRGFLPGPSLAYFTIASCHSLELTLCWLQIARNSAAAYLLTDCEDFRFWAQGGSCGEGNGLSIARVAVWGGLGPLVCTNIHEDGVWVTRNNLEYMRESYGHVRTVRDWA